MMVLAAAATLPHMPFNGDYVWEKARPSDYFKPRNEAKAIALPSIRQAIPELHLTTPSRDKCVELQNSGSLDLWTSSEAVGSPHTHKRRRVTNDEDQGALRVRQVPRSYRNSRFRAPLSPRLQPSPSATETWTTSTPTVSSVLKDGIPAPVEVKEIAMPRVTLPSLKATINYEGDVGSARDCSIDDGQYTPASGRPSPSSTYQGPGYEFSYHQRSRYQSQPPSPVRSFDRPPFSAGAYPPHSQEAGRFGDLGMAGIGGDTKQRKRRGNLPKETTDKLRAWFITHLQHPYPTEDEKQELMRRTGLQMNQISNWFINARRRQLPAMISNARAETDAINIGRGASGREGKALGSRANADYEGMSKRDALPLSDGEGGSCDEAMEILRRRRVGTLKRGSV